MSFTVVVIVIIIGLMELTHRIEQYKAKVNE